MAPVPALVSYYAGVNAYYLGDYAAAVQALENVVNHTDAAPGWPASPHLPGETLDLLQPDGLTSSQLAHYYRALAYSKLQNRQAATAAHAAFVRELHRWRAHLETHPAQATRLDDLLTRWQQQAQAGTAGPEDMGLASLLQRYGAAPLAPYFQGATLFFLGDHERARHALHQALAQLDQTQEPSLVPYFLGLTEWYLGQHGAAAVQLTGFLNQSCADALHAWRCAQARQILTGLSPRLGESATPGTPWLE
jgi:tetratricopeptide (TPR) repeat protein